MNAWPIFEPQNAASDLADHPNRVQLIHDAAGLAYPALCPNCGAAASRTIAVRKVFRRTYGDSATTYEIEGAVVPYCNPCIAQHEHEVRTLSWPQQVAVSLATGLTIAGLGSGFMALLFLPIAVQSVTRSGFPWPLVVVMFFALIAYSSLSGAWEQNAHRRVPPQTSITRAFDFSESHAEMFDAAGSTYSIRNSAFAEAFVTLNRERMWNPHSPAGKRAAHSRKLVYGTAIGALVAWALWEVATDLFGP